MRDRCEMAGSQHVALAKCTAHMHIPSIADTEFRDDRHVIAIRTIPQSHIFIALVRARGSRLIYWPA